MLNVEEGGSFQSHAIVEC